MYFFKRRKKEKTEEKPIKNENIDYISRDLYYIESTLSKLELINVSHGKTENLTNKISFYKNELLKLEQDYKKPLLENSITQEYETKINYAVKLSMLADELACFSKTYFYLENLDVFLHQEITESNIEEKKQELLELENKIQNHHDTNQEINNRLQEHLITAIEFLLEQEVRLTKNCQFYTQISKSSQLAIEKQYLKRLAEKAETNPYIQKYLQENDMEELAFDYKMFSYITLGNLVEIGSEISTNPDILYPNFLKELDIDILDISQLFGNKRLEIFKKRGTKAAISDFAILLGGYVSNSCYANDIKRLENRTGWYWTKTDDGDNDAHVVNDYGIAHYFHVSHRHREGGCRAALPFSSISSTFSNRERGTDGILEVEFGEYPQTAVSKTMQQELESLFQRGFLQPTGKKYTTDSVKYNQYDQPFQKQEHIEYEYNGKKYVRVKANSGFDGEKFTLSNGEQYQDGDYVWVEVQPIKWLVDKKNDIAVSEKLLFAGVQFNEKSNYKGDFNPTTMKWFLDNYFSKDIIPSKMNDKMIKEFLDNNKEASIESSRKAR